MLVICGADGVCWPSALYGAGVLRGVFRMFLHRFVWRESWHYGMLLLPTPLIEPLPESGSAD